MLLLNRQKLVARERSYKMLLVWHLVCVWVQLYRLVATACSDECLTWTFGGIGNGHSKAQSPDTITAAAVERGNQDPSAL